ncbi:MAG: hypothetical protein JWP64_4839 [Pseudonocardia sp.]|nr:hypothetical protein [Pseudonocardia sp.]
MSAPGKAAVRRPSGPRGHFDLVFGAVLDADSRASRRASPMSGPAAMARHECRCVSGGPTPTRRDRGCGAAWCDAGRADSGQVHCTCGHRAGDPRQDAETEPPAQHRSRPDRHGHRRQICAGAGPRAPAMAGSADGVPPARGHHRPAQPGPTMLWSTTRSDRAAWAARDEHATHSSRAPGRRSRLAQC